MTTQQDRELDRLFHSLREVELQAEINIARSALRDWRWFAVGSWASLVLVVVLAYTGLFSPC